MFALKQIIHTIAVYVKNFVSKLLPDRVPVTFLGRASAAELCESIAQTSATKLLIVTDAMLVKIGIVERITDALDAAGLGYSVYDAVEPDPTFPQVEAGLTQLRGEGCDAILALGGGSPMDAAKVMAARATNNKSFRQLEGLLKVRNAPLPLYAIPTTAGTGSEVTVAAVVSDPESHAKKFFIDPKLVPSMVALDPDLMMGLPPHITAATGMDALTHAVESYLATTANAQTRAYSVVAVRLIFKNLATAYRDGSDASARKAMALASYYGGLAFTRTSVGYVHAIAHWFGAYYRTPHGLANATVLPHILEFSRDASRARLAELADVIGLEGRSEADKAGRFIDAIRNLMSELDISPTLDALEPADITPIAREALSEAHMNYPVPRYMTQEECEGILSRIVA